MLFISPVILPLLFFITFSHHFTGIE